MQKCRMNFEIPRIANQRPNKFRNPQRIPQGKRFLTRVGGEVIGQWSLFSDAFLPG